MDPKVLRLATPEECDNFIENVAETDPELVRQALRRKVLLLAEFEKPQNECERDCWIAILSYEQVLLHMHGRNVKASRTRQKVNKVGLLPAVEDWVRIDADASGYRLLKELGLLQHTFEAVVDKHPNYFSDDAIRISREKLKTINAI